MAVTHRSLSLLPLLSLPFVRCHQRGEGEGGETAKAVIDDVVYVAALSFVAVVFMITRPSAMIMLLPTTRCMVILMMMVIM